MLLSSFVPIPQLNQASSGELALWQQPAWRALLHMPAHASLQPGEASISQIDDPRFFLAAGGRRDAKAELLASLKIFAAEQGSGTYKTSCRFPARWHWLQAHHAGAASWQEPACPALQEFLTSAQAQGVSLVYASAMMSDPASSFGHAFLRLDRPGQSPLTAVSIDHGALNTDAGSLSFIYKGVSGQFRAYYSVKPYYQKLNEYFGMEARDLWEFQLRFSPQAITRLLHHTWELQAISSAYYFFKQNCVFNIMTLLDAAWEGAGLSDYAAWWAVPLDQIKTLDQKGLIIGTQLRPATTARLEQMATYLPSPRLARAKRVPLDASVFDGGPVPLVQELDFAEEWLQYLQAREQQASPRRYHYALHRIAAARSQAGYFSYPALTKTSPLAAHPSSKIGLGVSSWGAFLRLRPAYHGLPDINRGLPPGSEVVALQTELGFHRGRQQWFLQRFDGIKVAAIAPISRTFQPLSYRLFFGLENPSATAGSLGKLHTGLSGGYGLPLLGGTLYGLAGGGFAQWPRADLDATVTTGYLLETAYVSVQAERRWVRRLITRRSHTSDLLALTLALGGKAQFSVSWEAHNARLPLAMMALERFF